MKSTKQIEKSILFLWVLTKMDSLQTGTRLNSNNKMNKQLFILIPSILLLKNCVNAQIIIDSAEHVLLELPTINDTILYYDDSHTKKLEVFIGSDFMIWQFYNQNESCLYEEIR